MTDEELSVMMMAAVADDAGHEAEADVPAAGATRPTKQRLRLNQAACERLIMAPFLLDPIIGHDIRSRRDAARSLRLQEAAERKREAMACYVSQAWDPQCAVAFSEWSVDEYLT